MMLNLNRNIRESIYIGDEVKVIILGIEEGRVRIGIEAPKEIKVHRQEVYEKIKPEIIIGWIIKDG